MDRPTGAMQIAWGWGLLILGFLLVGVGGVMDATSYQGVDADELILKWSAIYLGGGVISIGMLLLIAGWIIRALWFLPGRGIAEPLDLSSADIIAPEGGKRSDGAVWVALGALVLLAVMLYALDLHSRRDQALVTPVNATGVR